MLVCITAHHRNARFEVLEALAACNPLAAGLGLAQIDGVNGVVVVATCNRFEVYLDVERHAAVGASPDTVLETLSSSTGLASSVLSASVAMLSDQDVVPHLFSVASGLESVVIGEDEISGQVHRAIERARMSGTATADLERLFQTAARASKEVKASAGVGHAERSLVRLSLELAASRIATWHDTPVLLIGTGRYAATTIAALRDRGVASITAFSPSGRAEAFAARHSLRAAQQLADAIAQADVIISCTSGSEAIVTPAVVEGGQHRLFIDLGLPRNVSPEVALLPGIEVLDLETIRLHAPLKELTATSDAYAAVNAAVKEFSLATAERSAAVSVVALRRHVFALLEDELTRSRRRGTWTAEAEADLRHFVGVLLHAPSMRARELAREGEADSFASGLAALFGIELTDISAKAEENHLPEASDQTPRRSSSIRS